MGPLRIDDLPHGALLLIDSAPVIYYFEDHPKFADHFEPVFVAQKAGRLQFAVTPITITEVLTGPLLAKDEGAVKKYRIILDSWQFVSLSADIAESAARLRAAFRLKLPDALQAASALAINAAALVTSDRDFSHVRSLRVIS